MSNPQEERYLSDEAVDLATQLLRQARAGETRAEKAESAKLARLVEDRAGKDFTLELADQVLRVRSARRAAARFRQIVDHNGVPAFLSPLEQTAVRAGHLASRFLPWVVMPAVRDMVRQQSSKVILDGDHQMLRRHLDRRLAEGFRMNLNQLGEAVLGEDEAAGRVDQVLKLLRDPDVRYVSIKISNLFSQIHVVAFEHTLEIICERLRRLYRAAIANAFRNPDGRRTPKFVNLDMEEYRDVELTEQAFRRVLSEPEFRHLPAGIVLQAYLPDTHPLQVELTHWAKRRVEKGGAPIKIRLVKGANLAMETVDAELHGWANAVYPNKHEVDANFKRMVQFGCQPENAAAVRLGIASHNVFDIAWAMLVRNAAGTQDRVEFEMLEGMADHQARVVRDQAGGLLFYAPVVERAHFANAMAYLVRRLDENTHPANFLRHSFGMQPGSRAWRQQEELFRNALRERHQVSQGPRRRQNRDRERRLFPLSQPFANEPDTDFILPANREWLQQCLQEWAANPVREIPLVIAGEAVESADLVPVRDPGEPDSPVHRPTPPLYRVHRADKELVGRAITSAAAAQPAWEALGIPGRAAILARAAELIAARRGRLIAAMQQDAGKSIHEADVEISEAVDFANYYARGLDALPPGLTAKARGVIAVIPPWNFPFAIPVGGVMAALMAGNTVIFKPAPETVLTAWLGAEILWEAGVPRQALQFVNTPDNAIGKSLITDPRIAAIVFTGSTATATMFQNWRPELRLFAETSGKNSLVITAAADTDLAVKDLVRSAFGHAGQKCSAASLALVEAEVYDDPGFQRQLRDAAASLSVGRARELHHSVNTLIREPEGDLKRILVEQDLEPGQRWLLEPRNLDGNPRLWTPGILWGVRPSHWIVRAELFGPVLACVRVHDLDEAIRIQNSSPFGLTGGIHSLDEEEIQRWRGRVQVGNAYINRPITGAIVNRQPFGGWKQSSIGPGAKAGGRNYLFQLLEFEETALPATDAAIDERQRRLIDLLAQVGGAETVAPLTAIARSYRQAQAQEFAVEHDPSALAAESNVFRYRPRPGLGLLLPEHPVFDDLRLFARTQLACSIVGVPLEVSTPIEQPLLARLADEGYLSYRVESPNDLARRIGRGVRWDALRTGQPLSDDLRRALNQANIALLDSPPLAHGRYELVLLHHEQAVSETMHRYGNPTRAK